MRSYLLKRLAVSIPVFIGITVIIFALFSFAPGDALTAKMNKGMTPERKEELREMWGLDKPVTQRYVNWLSFIMRGDLGESTKYMRPVSEVIEKHIWASFLLALPSFLLSFLIAIPLGVLSATKQYSAFDNVSTVISMIGISMPGFFFILLLVKVSAVDLGWLPSSGMSTPGIEQTTFSYIIDVAKHMIIPVAVYTFGETAALVRYIRSSMLEIINQDYIRTARAKGLSERVVIYKHALKNAMIPVVTIFGMSLAGLFAGGMITETMMNWPGIGQIMMIAVNNRDYNLLMGYSVILTIITLLGNILADVLYAVVDPRIRYR